MSLKPTTHELVVGASRSPRSQAFFIIVLSVLCMTAFVAVAFVLFLVFVFSFSFFHRRFHPRVFVMLSLSIFSVFIVVVTMALVFQRVRSFCGADNY